MVKNNDKPPQVKLRLKSAPRIRQIFWCDFPKDAQKPEFWKRRPVVIISKNANLYGNVTFLPTSTKPQPDNPMAYRLAHSIDENPAWVICDYITTVSVSRLSAQRGAIPRIKPVDFDKILMRMYQYLPKPL